MPEINAIVAKDTEQEYRAIEQTLLGTARGRWFLAEHGRRSRRLDTVLLEDAIGRLSSSLTQPPPVLATLRSELEELSAFIGATKSRMVAKSTTKQTPPARVAGQDEGEASALASGIGIVAPVTRMLRMAEDIHELTWTLQSEELSPDSCEAIARHASMLYAMSRQQAMESERVLEFAKALDDAANRMSVLLDMLVHELNTYQEAVAPPPAEEDEDRSRKAG
jgi:uncharacterized coiled-coil protein SlyX